MNRNKDSNYHKLPFVNFRVNMKKEMEEQESKNSKD